MFMAMNGRDPIAGPKKLGTYDMITVSLPTRDFLRIPGVLKLRSSSRYDKYLIPGVHPISQGRLHITHKLNPLASSMVYTV